MKLNDELLTRPEREDDEAPIRLVNELAFGRPDEARLIDRLRKADRIVASLVAELAGTIVGHILFTSVELDGVSVDAAAALGPMSVLPSHQRSGIGSQLVTDGLDACRDAGRSLVVVVGHATYYPRFGFLPARARGVECEFDVPDEAWMITELEKGALATARGTVRYAPEFRS